MHWIVFQRRLVWTSSFTHAVISEGGRRLTGAIPVLAPLARHDISRSKLKLFFPPSLPHQLRYAFSILAETEG